MPRLPLGLPHLPLRGGPTTSGYGTIAVNGTT